MVAKVVHCKKSEYDVYIGRPSKFGNPFSHKEGTLAAFRTETRQEAIQKFEEWLQTQPQLIQDIKRELRNKTLGCFCVPAPCHGDILMKIANQPITLHLASYWEKQNHGPGKLIGITWNKPEDVKSDGLFAQFTPKKEFLDAYKKEKLDNPEKAGSDFISKYSQQLDEFVVELEKMSQEQGIAVDALLPFEDGDTLASWERQGYSNYRTILASYLVKLGYKVELH